MRTVLRFLFPAKSCSAQASGILLASRMIFGGLLFSHGIAKWSNFDTMSTMFPDPLGIGSSASLSLAIFGEVICSLGFIVGAFYRLALIPMIFTMCIAFFVIHGADPFAVKELALVYLAIFVLMYIAGKCQYPFDSMREGERCRCRAPFAVFVPVVRPGFRVCSTLFGQLAPVKWKNICSGSIIV